MACGETDTDLGDTGRHKEGGTGTDCAEGMDLMDSRLLAALAESFPGEVDTGSALFLPDVGKAPLSRIVPILCREGVYTQEEWRGLDPDFQGMLLGLLRTESRLRIIDLQRVKRALNGGHRGGAKGKRGDEYGAPTRESGLVEITDTDGQADAFNENKPDMDYHGRGCRSGTRFSSKAHFFYEFSVKRNPLDSLIPVHHRRQWYEATTNAYVDDPQRLRDALIAKCEMYVIFSALILASLIALFPGEVAIASTIDTFVWLAVECVFFSALLVLGCYLVTLTQVTAIPNANLVLWAKANISIFTFAGKAVIITLIGLMVIVGLLIWRFILNAPRDEIPAGFLYLPGVAYFVLAALFLHILFFHINVGSRSILETGCLNDHPISSQEELRNMTLSEASDVLFGRGHQRVAKPPATPDTRLSRLDPEPRAASSRSSLPKRSRTPARASVALF